MARLESVREGTVRAQDAGSQLVARALAAAPLDGTDTAWLDLCAGPGGKAALLGALGIQRGASLVANEAAPHRAQLVESSMRPLPEYSYTVLTGDGRQIRETLRKNASDLPRSIEPGQLFDRVMVDVPCSAAPRLVGASPRVILPSCCPCSVSSWTQPLRRPAPAASSPT